MIKKKVLITGGASGLGREIAKTYASLGWMVCVSDIDESISTKFVQSLSADPKNTFFTKCDVRIERDIENLKEVIIDKWDGVDIVVNCAGVAGSIGGIEDIPIEDWEWVLDINVMGLVRICKAFAPLFIEQESGHFINISSSGGLLNPPRNSPYNASKAAIVSISETMRVEFSEYKNIHVSVACPGFFPTNLAKSMRCKNQNSIAWVEKLMSRSKESAQDVSRLIVNGANRKKFLIHTHKADRRIYNLKRLLPNLYSKHLNKNLHTFKKKLN